MEFSPMLCQPLEAKTLAMCNPADWYAEPKLDGERIIAIRKGDTIQMWTRRGKEVSGKFPEVKIALMFLAPKEWVLDGELTAKGGFTSILKRNTDDKSKVRILQVKYPATYHIFDAIRIGTEDLTSKPLSERKQRLLTLFPKDELVVGYVKEAVKLVATLSEPDLYDAYMMMLRAGYEGIVIKRRSSTYQYDKRSFDWLKVKRREAVDVEVIGLTKSDAGQPFGALVLAKDGKYYGKVGSGFADLERIAILEMLSKKKAKTTIKLPPDVERELLFTITPVLCEVLVQEHFEDGTPRHPVFKRWRLT